MLDDSLRAISGADAVRSHIISFIEAGACGLRDECYAIKSRTKDPSSLVRKIKQRRKDGNERYGALDARDIVGIRLLSLHYANMRIICRRLIEFFNFSLQSPVGLFVGQTLDDMIEEIIVYRAAGSGLVYQDILSYLQTLGLGKKADGKAKVTSRASPPDRPYSSIHIVCYAAGPEITARPFIPVEIQIRTTLEDTWAEIDHARKYKAVLAKSSSFRSAAMLFNNVKEQLDTALSNIDRIIAHYDQIELEESRKALTLIRTSGLPRLEVEHKISGNAPAEIEKRVNAANRRVNALTEQFAKTSKMTMGLARKADSLIALIDGIAEDYAATNEETNVDKEFEYWSKMEQALLSIWVYRLSVVSGGTTDSSRERHFDRAISTYKGLIEVFPRDVWLRYRLATAMMVGGFVDLAAEEAGRAFDMLDSDPRVKSVNLLKSAIARQLSYIYWRKKQLMWTEGRGTAVQLSIEQQRITLLKAYQLGAEAFRLWRNASDDDPAKATERYVTLANLACYAWELKKLYDGNTAIEEIEGFLDELRLYLREERSREQSKTLSERDSTMKMADLVGSKLASTWARSLRDDLLELRPMDANAQFMLYCIERIIP